MRSWTHAICEDDWRALNPNKEPYRIVATYRELETCAFCDDKTFSGIYIRMDPKIVNTLRAIDQAIKKDRRKE